jgi:hypothetical protein
MLERPQAFRITFSSAAHFNRQLDGAGQVLVPQIRLLDVEQALGKGQRVVGVDGERHQAHHHALVGFGRMARQRQLVGS